MPNFGVGSNLGCSRLEAWVVGSAFADVVTRGCGVCDDEEGEDDHDAHHDHHDDRDDYDDSDRHDDRPSA